MSSSFYPALYMPRNGYVFIVTYGRSGSTLLMKLLNSISGACIRGENGDLLTPILRSIHDLRNSYNVCIRRTEIGIPLSERALHLRDILSTPNDPWFGAERIDIDDYARSILDCFVRTILCPPEKSTLLGFKDIHFYKAGDHFDRIMNCMLTEFPDGRIIFLTRDLDDVAKSGWWKDLPKKDVVHELGRANARFRCFHDAHKEKTMLFDYQEFFDRDVGVKRIFDFVGAEFDKSRVDEILKFRLNHLK